MTSLGRSSPIHTGSFHNGTDYPIVPSSSQNKEFKLFNAPSDVDKQAKPATKHSEKIPTYEDIRTKTTPDGHTKLLGAISSNNRVNDVFKRIGAEERLKIIQNDPKMPDTFLEFRAHESRDPEELKAIANHPNANHHVRIYLDHNPVYPNRRNKNSHEYLHDLYKTKGLNYDKTNKQKLLQINSSARKAFISAIARFRNKKALANHRREEAQHHAKKP